MADDKVKFKKNTGSSYHSLIQFVPAGQICYQHEEKKKNIGKDNEDTERCGNEAKAFYENLLNENKCNSSSTVSNISKRKHKKRQSKHNANSSDLQYHDLSKQFARSDLLNHRQHFKLLQNAQFGNHNDVKELLSRGLNIDFQDFYQWTPLMCAANEGHSTVVTLLLESGASKSLCNSTGKNASSLARNAGYVELANFIDKFEMKQREFVDYNDSISTDREETFYCGVCKLDFSSKEQRSHFSSTVHLFNSGKKTHSPAYLIPETNRGFQMLLRNGWKTDRGLGPDGKGPRYPVKTILKHDRKCLGDEGSKNEKKARITHFDANDERAVQTLPSFSGRTLSVKTMVKKGHKLKEKREKRKEINLRLQFS